MSDRPHAAEVARTMTAGHGTASLTSAFGTSAVPVLQASLDGGELVVLVGRSDLRRLELDGLLEPGEDRVVLVDVRSYAPLPDLTLIRAHLSAAGWARLAEPDQRTEAMAALAAVFGPEVIALDGPWSDRVLLVVEVAECELHWPSGCTRIDAEEFALAEVDPLAGAEGHALERVQATCADRLLVMVRQLRPTTSDEDDLSRATALRPVGLDRYGLTMRCSLPAGDAGLGRLSFPVPATTVAEAEALIATLLDRHERCQIGQIGSDR